MNKDRRKRLEGIVKKLEELKGEIEGIGQEEQEYFDNIPESFQVSEKGETAEEHITNLEEAADQVNEAVEYIGEVVNS